MRRLSKLEKPQVLIANEQKWADEYLEAVRNGVPKKPEKWRHREIKETLRRETEAKCAYCEALVDDVSFPHVEHILPRIARPDLALCWVNLTSACGRCNNAKLDYYDPDMPLINPYIDDLEQHLAFFGSLIQHAPGDSRAELSVLKLDLNRMDLVQSRLSRIQAVRTAFDRWYASSGALKSALEVALRRDIEQGEFTRSVSSVLTQLGFPIAVPKAQASLH